MSLIEGVVDPLGASCKKLIDAIRMEDCAAVVEIMDSGGVPPDALLVPEGMLFARSVLQYAVGLQKTGVARLLLSRGADPNMVTRDTLPPVVLATLIEPISVAKEMVRLLLEHRADIRAEGCDRTVLTVNAHTPEMVRFLLQCGAPTDGALEYYRGVNRQECVGAIEDWLSAAPPDVKRAE